MPDDSDPDAVLEYETPSSTQFGEYAAMTFMSGFALIGAFIVAGASYGIVLLAFGDDVAALVCAAVGGIAVMLSFAAIARRRLVFSVTVGPDGVELGRRLIPYDDVDAILIASGSPEEKWIEICSERWSRRVYLGDDAADCARAVYRRSLQAILVDENGNEHAHSESPDPVRGIRTIVGFREKSARRAWLAVVGAGLWTLLFLGISMAHLISGGFAGAPVVIFLVSTFFTAFTISIAVKRQRSVSDARRRITEELGDGVSRGGVR